MSACTACGATFTPPAAVGRPTTRCPRCRGTVRSDDTAWRMVRERVLREEPICAIPGCGRPSTTVDHIVPLARGGTRLDRANLQGMCGPHNFSKGARPVPGNRSGEARTPARRRRICSCGDPTCPIRWHL